MAIKIKKGSTPSQFQVNQVGRKRISRTLSDSVCLVVVSIVAACATGTSIVEIEQICGEGFLIITPKNPDRQLPARRSFQGRYFGFCRYVPHPKPLPRKEGAASMPGFSPSPLYGGKGQGLGGYPNTYP